MRCSRYAGSRAHLTPTDAKRALFVVLARGDVCSANAYVAADLTDLRLAFRNDDEAFASAVQATAQEIARALASPDSWGRGLEHDLAGWRRSAFPPYDGSEADLRLIFRAHGCHGVDVLSFGLLFHPDTSSIYHLAKARL
ncbi:hypothetical protein EPN44_11600 [bacterium]|nr:MAG: hypothetical protein EPN44_11600 [bacterium]